MGKKAFMDKKCLLTGSPDLDLRKRFIRSTIWSIVLYAAEARTLSLADRNRLETYVVWIWRRMEQAN